MTEQLQEGSSVRLKSGTEGSIRGEIVEYVELGGMPGAYTYIGPSYKVHILEGKHKGETITMPANFVEPIGEHVPSVALKDDTTRSAALISLNVTYSVAQLRAMARDANIPTTGLKLDLIERLIDRGILKA